jgi:Sulfatase
LRTVKPYTRKVRAEIDIELVAKSIDFMKRQTAAGKPFFLYLPFSMGHFPNLPSKQFAGKSRIANTATSSWKAIITSVRSSTR